LGVYGWTRSECSHLSDCYRYGYQNEEVEVDLESALDVANIKVDRESKEYKLLIGNSICSHRGLFFKD
jgi:hypothetical protein